MNYLLAIETSGKFGSVAIASRNMDSLGPIVSVDLPRESGSAQSLAQCIRQIMQANQVSFEKVGCIALVNGPGSFTGLRVGIATAKSLAYGLGIPVVGLDTLEVIHLQAEAATSFSEQKHPIRHVHAMLDAYRGQIFVKSKDGQGQYSDTRVLDFSDFLTWCRSVDPEPTAHAMVGPGVSRIRSFLEREFDAGVLRDWSANVNWFSEQEFEPHAKFVARLGLQHWARGEQIEPFALLPNYFRGSAAEEKAKAV
jgi:tRNA threonylcarbamoyladenosine biosynthesis protein TsaB